jgi:hypothetical protein
LTASSRIFARRSAIALAYVGAGILGGCYSAYLAIQSTGVEPASVDGMWLSRAAGLTGPASYYVRSHYLMEGRLPPAPGQIIEATAETDKDGARLLGRCRYRITSSGPLAAWWSLAAAEPGGLGGSLQAVMASDGVVRSKDGTVDIALSASPQPGNWLRAPESRSIELVYSALPAGAQRRGAPPFAITREDCP